MEASPHDESDREGEGMLRAAVAVVKQTRE
jgi:hypothetical protein